MKKNNSENTTSRKRKIVVIASASLVVLLAAGSVALGLSTGERPTETANASTSSVANRVDNIDSTLTSGGSTSAVQAASSVPNEVLMVKGTGSGPAVGVSSAAPSTAVSASGKASASSPKPATSTPAATKPSTAPSSKAAAPATTNSKPAAATTPSKPATPATNNPVAPASVNGDVTAQFGADVLALVNQARAAAGLAPLSGNDAALNATAAVRAKELVTSYSHTRPDGTLCFTAFPGVPMLNYGENIAEGYGGAAAVMNGWMNSPGHKANILGDYNTIGIGVYESGGTIYWVQDFMKI